MDEQEYAEMEPFERYGLTFRGVFNEALFADQWVTYKDNVEYYIVDHGRYVNLVIIDGDKRVGHTMPSMAMAAMAVAHKAGVLNL